MDWWITNNQNLFTTINQRLPDPLPDLERSPNGHGTIGSCRSPRPQCLVRAFTAQAVTIILARHRQRQSTPRSQRSQRGYETCIPREQRVISHNRATPINGATSSLRAQLLRHRSAQHLSHFPLQRHGAAPSQGCRVRPGARHGAARVSWDVGSL